MNSIKSLLKTILIYKSILEPFVVFENKKRIYFISLMFITEALEAWQIADMNRLSALCWNRLIEWQKLNIIIINMHKFLIIFNN